MCSSREFQIWVAATGKARLPTVESLTGGTTCRLCANTTMEPNKMQLKIKSYKRLKETTKSQSKEKRFELASERVNRTNRSLKKHYTLDNTIMFYVKTHKRETPHNTTHACLTKAGWQPTPERTNKQTHRDASVRKTSYNRFCSKNSRTLLMSVETFRMIVPNKPKKNPKQ